MAPAAISVRGVAVSERYTKPEEGKVAETVMSGEEWVMPEEKGVVSEREAVESVGEETLAGEGSADKAVSTGDEHAPAGEHAATETAAAEMRPSKSTSTEMHSTRAEPTVEPAATQPTVEAPAAEPTVEAPAAEAPAAAERQGWRCPYDRRRHRGRG